MSRFIISVLLLLTITTGCVSDLISRLPAPPQRPGEVAAAPQQQQAVQPDVSPSVAPVTVAVTVAPAPHLTVYLVRHAEKVLDGTRDPALTPAGHRRADALADLLHGVELTQVHTTNYRRTRETALPTARRRGIKKATAYTGDDLADVAQKIIARGGTHLVVGHSNTTGELAQLISGKASPAIADDEYDRLYIITRNVGAAPTLAVVRFAPGPMVE